MRTNENENSINTKCVLNSFQEVNEKFEGEYVSARVVDGDSVVRIIDLD